MTAEVIVMNRKGVAMAADSAGTLYVDRGYKIYNSDQKLFQLLNKSQIGMLIYGSTSLNGAPMELLIKDFREKNKNSVWDKTENCEESFIKYLEGPVVRSITDEKRHIFNSAMYTADVVRRRNQQISENMRDLQSIREEMKLLKKKKDEEKLSRLQADEEALVDSLEDMNYDNYLENTLQEFNKYDNVEGFDDSFARLVNKTYGKYIKENIEKNLEGFNIKFTPRELNIVCRICELSIYKEQAQLRKNAIGLAFAGYGEKEYYPSMVSLEIFGAVCGKVLYRTANKFTISIKNPMYICPLAQTEEVDTFVFGISPRIRDALMKNIEQYTNDSILKFVESLPETSDDDNIKKADYCKAIEQAQKSMSDDVWNMISKMGHDNLHNIYDALNWLSLPELAKMARSLIELAKFKKQMSVEFDTVGGPIDVAVISKADGFAWIDKKEVVL